MEYNKSNINFKMAFYSPSAKDMQYFKKILEAKNINIEDGSVTIYPEYYIQNGKNICIK